MTRWNILSCCTLLILAGAVVQKRHELSGLRHQARQCASQAVVQETTSSGLTSKPHGERPEQAADDDSQEEKRDRLERMTIFEDDGELTKAAIDELKLNQEEATALSGAVQRFRAQASHDLADRLKPKALLSDEGTGHQRYYARARRDRGLAWFDSLTLEFGSVIGQDRSRSLVKNLIKRDFFAQLCTLDLDLVVTPPTEESKEATVRYYLRRPRDGSFSMSSGSTLAQFEAEFGKLFGEEETGGQ